MHKRAYLKVMDEASVAVIMSFRGVNEAKPDHSPNGQFYDCQQMGDCSLPFRGHIYVGKILPSKIINELDS